MTKNLILILVFILVFLLLFLIYKLTETKNTNYIIKIEPKPNQPSISFPTKSSIPPYLNPENGCKVYPHIYIGNAKFASDKALLKGLGITHIVNAAQEIPDFFKGDSSFQYLHLKMDDIPEENASRFFQVSSDFIMNAIKNGGTVLVHCAMGISRSVTILMYYLMKTLHISSEEALQMVRNCRPIAQPNPGFMEQLNRI